MSLRIAREGESPMQWQYAVKSGGIAGRVDDYLVPLRAGSTYSLRLNLTQFWSANEHFASPALRSGSYRISADFNGGGAQFINLDTPGMRLMHIWTGQLRSEEIAVEIK